MQVEPRSSPKTVLMHRMVTEEEHSINRIIRRKQVSIRHLVSAR